MCFKNHRFLLQMLEGVTVSKMKKISRYFNKNNKIIGYIKLEKKVLNSIEFNNNELSVKTVQWVINEANWTFKYINKHLKSNQKQKLKSIDIVSKKQPKISQDNLKQIKSLDITKEQTKNFPKDSISLWKD